MSSNILIFLFIKQLSDFLTLKFETLKPMVEPDFYAELKWSFEDNLLV